MGTRWSDDNYLDQLRQSTDMVADDCVAGLDTHQDFANLFRDAGTNNSVLPSTAPEALQKFFESTDRIIRLEPDLQAFPDGVDHARLKRGEHVFLDHAFFSCVVLLAKSLPEGYAAPCLSRLLVLSGNLEKAPYRRLLGVLQLVVDVTSTDGFEKGGRAIAAARQARLMHAGIRRFVPKLLPEYESTYHGPPVNLEDMLATIMGLSLLVIDGLPRLGDALADRDAEDYYYLWRAFAVAMGIHPPGQHGSAEWVPATLNEAREFYQAYQRRHYEHNPVKNPWGVALAEENLKMLHDLLPELLHLPGLRRIPELFMTQLMGNEACGRVGLAPYEVPLGLHTITVGALSGLVGLGRWFDSIDPAGNFHPTISTLLLQGMIKRQFGDVVTFEIPESIRQVQELVRRRRAADSGTAAGTTRQAPV